MGLGGSLRAGHDALMSTTTSKTLSALYLFWGEYKESLSIDESNKIEEAISVLTEVSARSGSDAYR